MIKKEKFLRFIELYHLGGTVESSILNVENGDLNTIFQSSAKDLRGKVELKDFDFDNTKIGIYTTSELIRLLSIVDGDLEVIDTKRADGVTVNLKFNDKKKEFKYVTCSPDIIDSDGKTSQISSYDVELTLDKLLIADILKSITAINTKKVTFVNDNKKLFIYFNYSENNDNMISFEIPFTKLDNDFENMSFDSGYIKQILAINNNKFTEAKLSISLKGVLEINFKDNDLGLESNYWIIKQKD